MANGAQGGNSVALRLVTNGGNTVGGNFIGLDPTGTIRLANGCQGLGIVSGGNNTIGGLSPGDRNVISGTDGCGEGLVIDGSAENEILNNYLGTNAAGTASRGSSAGVLIGRFAGIHDATDNVIGGTTAAARNVISGNGIGVVLSGSGTSGNPVIGNFIGTNASGTFGVGNNTGVEITSSAHHNRTGGTAVGEGNTIAFNNGIGVSLDAAPFAAGPGNSILGNSIFSNNGLGIDLNADGVTANDACDADTGPNNLQNFPIITSVTASVGSTNIQGTLNSTASTGPFEIEFFSSPSCNAGPPNDFGEGQTFLGIATPSTDPSCNATFNVTLPVTVSAGSVITATATDPGLNTSEFSQCFLVVGGPTATPTNTPTNTPAGVATNTPTNTPTVISPTPTQPAGVVVPMLSPSMLGLLALVLIAAAFFVMRRL